MLGRQEAEQFGTLLRHHRVEASLTQEELAEHAGISVRAVQVLERGDTHPHKDTAERLAQALGLVGDLQQRFLAAARSPPHLPASARSRDPASTSPTGSRRLSLVTSDDAGTTARPIASPGHNLPLEASSFIGREHELAEIERLLAGTRVLTLLGAGGAGKTRLLLRLAAQVQPKFADGSWLVELGPLAEPSLVPQAIASTLQVREQSGRSPLESVVDTLRTKELLLLLDNCEHVVDAVAQVVDDVVRACAHVSILTTSREALRIAAETQYRVPSLAVPDLRQLPAIDQLGRYEAIQLFGDRARAVQPRFALTEQNARAVAEICCRLDGIPLAIELAAARTRMLTPEQIARRLDDRFRLLVGGERTAPSRQQTLRGLIDWSYELLADKERRLLGRLAVFAGGFALEAAETVTAGAGIEESDVFDVLTQLVDRSLVISEEQVVESRYRLLDTIREYARARLEEAGEAETIRRRHYDWCLGSVERDEPTAATAEQEVWAGRLRLEEDNLRAVLAWCLKGDAMAGLRLVGSLWRYWDLRDIQIEGAGWLERMLARAAESMDLPAKSLLDAAVLAQSQGSIVGARSLARALMAVGWLTQYRGDYRQARARYEEGLDVCRAIGDEWGIRWTLVRLAFLPLSEGDTAKAREVLEESLALARRGGDRTAIAWALNRLSIVAHYDGDFRQTRALLMESLEVLGEEGDKRFIAWSLGDLGNLASCEGDYERAEGILQESLTQLRKLGTNDGIFWRLLQLGHLARCRGDNDRARALFEESRSIAQELGGRLEIGLALEGLAIVTRSGANYQAARTRFGESLRVIQATGQKPAIAHCLWLMGILAVQQGTHALGVRLIGSATAHKLFGTLIYPPERAESEAVLTIARAALGEPTFAQLWAEGRSMTLEQAISHALQEP
jgi:predicted ATPase/transcriptional regulator with XRE-family HTH domain